MTETHLPYATLPARGGAGRTWAGAAIAFAGVSLLVVGGCFLIGVLVLVSPNALANAGAGGPPPPMAGPAVALMCVLYAMAAACFAGGAALIVVGTVRLLQIMKG